MISHSSAAMDRTKAMDPARTEGESKPSSTPSCNVCESTRIETVYHFEMAPSKEGRGWSLVVLGCKACGLKFLDEASVRASVDWYNDLCWREMWGPLYAKHGDEVRANVEGKCAWLKQWLPANGQVLDLGCGEGTFLAEAQRQGFTVAGVDVAVEQAEVARERVGRDAIFSTTSDALRAGRRFDAVTLWDVLEHLEDPQGTLRDVQKLLRPGGVAIISTPNARSLLHRIAHYSHRATFNRSASALRRIYYLGHLFYFDTRTLRHALSLAGFESSRLVTDLKAPGGLFDNLDALFGANSNQLWTRIPLMKPAIAGLVSTTRRIGEPYRMLAVAHAAK